MNLKYLEVLIVSVVVIATVSGCTSTPEPTASTITRAITPSTVAPGGTISVTLDVNVNDERFYVIEEIPPAGWEVVDNGEFVVDQQGHMKWVQLQDTVDKTYTFTLKAPSTAGNYTFTGIYSMDGMDTPASIAGTSSVAVS